MYKTIYILYLISSFVVISCGTVEDSTILANCDDSKPVIKNLLIDFNSWNGSDPGEAGDFILNSNNLSEKYIYAFGEYLSPSKRIPNIEFRPKVTSLVRSPVKGRIIDIRDNMEEGKGHELFIRTKSNSCYLILIDHVRNLTVSKNQDIEAGDPLGEPGLYSETFNIGQVELQVNNDKRGSYDCPMSFMHSDVLSNYVSHVNQFRADVESLLDDNNAFDESLDFGDYNLCHNESILEAEL